LHAPDLATCQRDDPYKHAGNIAVLTCRARKQTSVRPIIKQYGLVAVAKHIIEDNNAHGISEAEFTDLICEGRDPYALGLFAAAHNDHEGHHNSVFDRRASAYRVQFAVLQHVDVFWPFKIDHGSLL
jgi:hypothetical protein